MWFKVSPGTVHDNPLQNNQNNMDWRHGSITRAPALQAQRPEFKLHSTKHIKKKRQKNRKGELIY
jgi:hypothetical protein